MKTRSARAILIGIGVVCVAWVAACAPAGPPAPGPAVDGGDPTQTVYLVRNRLHTGIVMAREAPVLSLLAEAADFPDAPYLEFGWGDRDYYPDPDPTAGMGLSALMTPTDSVVKIAGRGPPPFTGADDWLSLPVSEAEFERIVEAIDASFDRTDGGRAEPIPGGRQGSRNFYPAHGRFHLLNTCNNWVARALAGAGIEVSATGAMTGAELMRRVRELPRVPA